MSAPPLELIIAGILAETLGPVIWGYICSRLHERIFGVFLLFLPPLILILIWPGLLDPGALPFFAMYGALALVGYIAGLLISKRAKKKSP